MNVRDAQAVLRSNTRTTLHGSRYTVPSSRLYPHQWAWDSAFIAVGYSTFDVSRALEELETLFSAQWPDGRIPHIVFWHPGAEYFPGPREWGRATSSTITNPMVFGLALEKIAQRAGPEHDARIGALASKIERAHGFMFANRDPLRIGAVACMHPWESGRDNCVAWDCALARVESDHVDVSGRTDQEKVDKPDQRPSDDAYRSFLALVHAIREADFTSGPFAVYDPFLTALMYRSERALLRLSDRVHFSTRAKSRSERLHAALHTELFDDALGGYINLDANTGERAHHDTLAALQPLCADPPPGRKARLAHAVERLRLTPFAAPTLSPTADGFDAIHYWRGPLWANMNWLAEPHFGKVLRTSTLKLIAAEGFREYYNPLDGAGLGAREFSWTAALALDWWANEPVAPIAR